jgi:ATP-dependent Lon protease
MASDFLSIINPTDLSRREQTSSQGRVLPILPVRSTVLFPHAVLPLTVGRESSIQLIQSLGEQKTIVVVAQRDERMDSPQPSDLYSTGTLATVHKVVKMPNQSLFVFTEGTERVKLGEFTQLEPFMMATVDHLPEVDAGKTAELEALQRNVIAQFQQIVTTSLHFPTSCRPSL